MMKILDLYAGPGGTARGIQSVMPEVEYYAIEYDKEVCELHKKNNPNSIVICDNAYNWLDKLNQYDFIWMSPPCETHSRLNSIYKKPIDWRLFQLIDTIQFIRPAAVIENTIPYYKVYYELKPIEIGRHYIWSNFPIKPFEVKKREKNWSNTTIKDWEELKGLKFNNRKQARNCLRPEIAAEIFRQFLAWRELDEVVEE